LRRAGDIQEFSNRLGHGNIATMRVYAHEFDAARRSPERRARLAARYGNGMAAGMAAPGGTEAHQPAPPPSAEVVDCQAKRTG
jgi:hypothetical protein